MAGPGQYIADVTEGITRVEDLPKPKIVRRSRNYKRRRCPRCERSAYRLRSVTRVLHDLGDSRSGQPRDLVVTYSQHRCPNCNCYFNADMDEVYRLFDRCCRTDTALETLAQLRRRVSRFHTLGKTLNKLFSPNLEKALTFLDDSLLPSTSNAVERANRRHRKMQKSVSV